MNARVACAITVLIGTMYAATGLLTSLTDVGIGIAIAAAGIIGYGLCDYTTTRHNQRITATRAQVWARRDNQGAHRGL
jgi:hypothetical protein